MFEYLEIVDTHNETNQNDDLIRLLSIAGSLIRLTAPWRGILIGNNCFSHKAIIRASDLVC